MKHILNLIILNNLITGRECLLPILLYSIHERELESGEMLSYGCAAENQTLTSGIRSTRAACSSSGSLYNGYQTCEGK